MYSSCFLASQSLHCWELYYEKGEKSQWLATLVQLAGFPHSHSLLLLLVSQKLDCNKFWHSSPTIRPGSRVDLCFHWPSCSNILPSLLDGVVIPSRVYIFTHLCITVSFQCFLLVFSQFTKVHPFRNQFSNPSYRLIYPSRVSWRLVNSKWSFKREERDQYHMHHYRISGERVVNFSHAVLLSEGHKKGIVFSSHGFHNLSVTSRIECNHGGTFCYRRMDKSKGCKGRIWTRKDIIIWWF